MTIHVTPPAVGFLRRQPRTVTLAGAIAMVLSLVFGSPAAAIVSGIVVMVGCWLWLDDARYQTALDDEYERVMLDLRD
jgi:hypothetical protein